MAREQLTCVES